jgi:hypothetical protein
MSKDLEAIVVAHFSFVGGELIQGRYVFSIEEIYHASIVLGVVSCAVAIIE